MAASKAERKGEIGAFAKAVPKDTTWDGPEVDAMADPSVASRAVDLVDSLASPQVAVTDAKKDVSKAGQRAELWVAWRVA